MDKETTTELLLTWHERVTRANLAHYRNSEALRRLNNVLTVFNLLAAISVLFIANNSALEGYINFSPILLSGASLLVVLTTALHYVLKLDARIYDHKNAGNEFTELKRKIELLLLNDNIQLTELNNIKRDYDYTSKNHDLVPRGVWSRISDRYKSAAKENEFFVESLGLKRPDNEEEHHP